MPKDTPKTGPRPPASRRGGRVRSGLRRRGEATLLERLADLYRSPVAGWGVIIALVAATLAAGIAIWTREQPLVSVGRVMNETRLVRVPFTLVDTLETEKKRESVRLSVPGVYVADLPVLAELRSSLENLPRTLASVSSLADVETGIRERFRLTEEGLAAVQAEAVAGEPSPDYLDRVHAFMAILERTPLLGRDEWQRWSQSITRRMEVRLGPGGRVEHEADRAVNIDDAEMLRTAIDEAARLAGFARPMRQVIVGRLSSSPRATFRYDAASTEAKRNAAAEAVEPIVNEWPVGAVIYSRGYALTPAQYEVARAELEYFAAEAPTWRIALRRASIAGAVFAVAAGVAFYAALFSPRMRRNVSRIAWIACLLVGAQAIACLATVTEPWMLSFTGVAPTVFVAAIVVIAYDQRVALAVGCLHGILVCVALDQSIGMFAVIVTGVAVAVWRLRDIRQRNALVKMGAFTAAGLAAATLLAGLADRPIVADSLRESLGDAALAGVGGLVVGGVVLFLLPVIERAFDITTGMTLIELRDPKQPLLRELQQRAPGTYNHSLNVASIAEAAADAVGADPLRTYVGALYHDVGKMNKPEYFVENQSGGINKHDKLSPAMSLLVIVGHVKDGVELAREYALPRSLFPFIEQHHGTTLVEFFYHRARKQAEEQAGGADDKDMPSEIEYRYPGPKPQSKETAILMLADAVESATRTLSEPTPSRIDALVRSLANKRLMDGQFDECDLTLRELSAIVESISKSVASIYHGRIAYPAGAKPQPKTAAPKPEPEAQARA